MKPTSQEFGALLRDARVKAGLSQRGLAKLIDRDATTVSRWETGERRPKQGSLLSLSNLLGVRIQSLQSAAGYTPEFDWLASLTGNPDSQEDILHSASEAEKESLRQYLHFLRFREQLPKSHSTRPRQT